MTSFTNKVTASEIRMHLAAVGLETTLNSARKYSFIHNILNERVKEQAILNPEMDFSDVPDELLKAMKKYKLLEMLLEEYEKKLKECDDNSLTIVYAFAQLQTLLKVVKE